MDHRQHDRNVILPMPAALEELKRGVTETGGSWEAHGVPPAAEAARS